MDIRLERLQDALNLCGIPIRGRVKAVCEKTGYSQGMVSKILSGKVEMADKFIKLVCSVFNINVNWVLEGKAPVLSDGQITPIVPIANWSGQPLVTFQGERLRKVRESLGYSIEELAEQLNTDVATLQQCENALSIKDTYILNKMAQLCININWLMTGRGKMRLEEWPIVISKENSKSDWSGRSINVSYKIDDLFTTRLKITLKNRSAKWLSDETHIDSQKIVNILSGETIPSVDELESIAYVLGRINPGWLAEKSNFPTEDWGHELFRDASALDLPYRIYNLCETAVEEYINELNGLINLSSDDKKQIIGALGRIHLKESPLHTEINKEMISVLIDRLRFAEG